MVEKKNRMSTPPPWNPYSLEEFIRFVNTKPIKNVGWPVDVPIEYFDMATILNRLVHRDGGWDNLVSSYDNQSLDRSERQRAKVKLYQMSSALYLAVVLNLSKGNGLNEKAIADKYSEFMKKGVPRKYLNAKFDWSSLMPKIGEDPVETVEKPAPEPVGISAVREEYLPKEPPVREDPDARTFPDINDYLRQWDALRDSPEWQERMRAKASREAEEAAKEAERQAEYAENRRRANEPVKPAEKEKTKKLKGITLDEMKVKTLAAISQLSKNIKALPAADDDESNWFQLISIAILEDFDVIRLDNGRVVDVDTFVSNIIDKLSSQKTLSGRSRWDAIVDSIPKLIDDIEVSYYNPGDEFWHWHIKDSHPFEIEEDGSVYVDPIGLSQWMKRFQTRHHVRSSDPRRDPYAAGRVASVIEETQNAMEDDDGDPLYVSVDELNGIARHPRLSDALTSVISPDVMHNIKKAMYSDLESDAKERKLDFDADAANDAVDQALDFLLAAMVLPRNARVYDDETDSDMWIGAYLSERLAGDPLAVKAMNSANGLMHEYLYEYKNWDYFEGTEAYLREQLKEGLETAQTTFISPVINGANYLRMADWRRRAAENANNRLKANKDVEYRIPKEARLAALDEVGADESVDGVLRRLLLYAADRARSHEKRTLMSPDLADIVANTDDDTLNAALKAVDLFEKNNPEYEGIPVRPTEYEKHMGTFIGSLEDDVNDARGELHRRRMYLDYMDDMYTEFESLHDYPDLLKLNSHLLYLYDQDFVDERGRPVPNLLREISGDPRRPEPLRDLVRLMGSENPDKQKVVKWISENLPYRKDILSDLLKKAYKTCNDKDSPIFPHDNTHIRTPFDIWKESVNNAPENIGEMIFRNDFEHDRDEYIMRLRHAMGIKDDEVRIKALNQIANDIKADVTAIRELATDPVVYDRFVPPRLRTRVTSQSQWQSDNIKSLGRDLLELGKAVHTMLKRGDAAGTPAPEWSGYGSMEELLSPDPGIYRGRDRDARLRREAQEVDDIKHARNARRYFPHHENADMWHLLSDDPKRTMSNLQKRGLVTGRVSAQQMKRLGDMTMPEEGAGWRRQTATRENPELNDEFIKGALEVAKNLVPFDEYTLKSFDEALSIARRCNGKVNSEAAWQNEARKRVESEGGEWNFNRARVEDLKRPAKPSEMYAVYNRAIGGRRWTATTARPTTWRRSWGCPRSTAPTTTAGSHSPTRRSPRTTPSPA